MWLCRMPPLFSYLAAAAVGVAAGVAAAAAAAQEAAAAVAQNEDQNDDPANVTATETVVVAHNDLPPKIFQRFKPLIPRYSPAAKRCNNATDDQHRL